MRRKIALAVLLCLAAALSIGAAPALAKAHFITYTAQETPVLLNVSDPVSYGSVQKLTMANHLLDSGATHPWGNCDVFTNSSWVVHTSGGVWTDSTFTGSYRTEGADGDTAGRFTGSMSWITGEMDYRFTGKGVSGELVGTLWKGTCHSPAFPYIPTQMSVRILVP